MQPCQPAGYSTHECAKLSLGNETVEKNLNTILLNTK